MPSVGHRYITELGTEISGSSVGNKNINTGTIILYVFMITFATSNYYRVLQQTRWSKVHFE